MPSSGPAELPGTGVGEVPGVSAGSDEAVALAALGMGDPGGCVGAADPQAITVTATSPITGNRSRNELRVVVVMVHRRAPRSFGAPDEVVIRGNQALAQLVRVHAAALPYPRRGDPDPFRLVPAARAARR